MSVTKFDVDSLTLDEVEAIEEHTGKDISDLLSMNVLSGKTAKVLVWIMRKRDEPELKIEDCGNMTLAQLTEFLGADNPKG